MLYEYMYSRSLCCVVLRAGYTEYIFLSTFICEVVIKIYAIGFRHYWAASFNRFDCVV